jgi:hypothetical protein
MKITLALPHGGDLAGATVDRDPAVAKQLIRDGRARPADPKATPRRKFTPGPEPVTDEPAPDLDPPAPAE